MLKFILSIILLGSVLLAQEIIILDKENSYYKDRTLYYKDSNQPVTGVVRDVRDINKVRKYFVSTYIDGKKNGTEEYYFKKKLSAKTPYKDGRKHGIQYWYKYGKINRTDLYKQGERVGYTMYYDYDKKSIKKSVTKKDGITHTVRYNKSGNILYDCSTDFPNIVGKCVAYYPTGELLGEITQNGNKFSGFVYNKNGDKVKATKKDHNRMFNDIMGQDTHIKEINDRLKKSN